MNRSKVALIFIHHFKSDYNFYRTWRVCIELGHANEDELESFFGVKKEDFLGFRLRSGLAYSNITLSNMMFDAEFGTIKWIDVHSFIVKNGAKISQNRGNKEFAKVRADINQNHAMMKQRLENFYDRKLYGKVGGQPKRGRIKR